MPGGTASGHGIVIQNVIQSAPQPQPLIAFAGAGMMALKSRSTAGWLAFLFGPLGMFYASTQAAMIMLVVSLVVIPLTLGLGIFITWPICVIWALSEVDKHNARVLALSGHVPQPISSTAPAMFQAQPAPGQPLAVHPAPAPATALPPQPR